MIVNPARYGKDGAERRTVSITAPTAFVNIGTACYIDEEGQLASETIRKSNPISVNLIVGSMFVIYVQASSLGSMTIDGATQVGLIVEKTYAYRVDP